MQTTVATFGRCELSQIGGFTVQCGNPRTFGLFAAVELPYNEAGGERLNERPLREGD